jgi:large subunit ribosomal protein L3
MTDRQVKGILGTKLGMTQVFDEKNRVVPVTVVLAGPNVVTQIRTMDNDGYTAVQLAFGNVDPRKVNSPAARKQRQADGKPAREVRNWVVTSPVAGHFEKAGVAPKRYLAELRTTDAETYEVGQEITAEVFAAGAKVDVTGTSKGKGYAGVMKRHGFKGQGASHGAQAVHRKPGSIGGCATPGRVFKGVRMAGRMGHEKVTTQGLTVHDVRVEDGLLLIKGAVPGPKGSLVFVRSAVKGGAGE